MKQILKDVHGVNDVKDVDYEKLKHQIEGESMISRIKFRK